MQRLSRSWGPQRSTPHASFPDHCPGDACLFALIALEYWVSVRRGLRVYRMHDMVASLSCGILSKVTALFTKAFMVGIYAFCFEHLALTRLPMDNLAVWAAGLFLYDFSTTGTTASGMTKALFWAAPRCTTKAGLQPVDGAAPDQHRLDRQLGVLPAHGGDGFPARDVRGAGADRPALPVLGAHPAGGAAGLVRPGVLLAQQPPGPPLR